MSRPEIRRLLDENGLRPSRARGQNFVADPNTVRRIARLAGVGPGDRVIEIGAGLGSLTLALAETGATVTAVEVDRGLVPVLRSLVEPAGVTVVEADAMRLDWDALLGDGPWVLVANLPYNVATPLVADLLDRVPAITRMLVMVQREVAERLAAGPGDDAYGAVSVKVAYWATASVAGLVPASVFVPVPNVESALVRIERRDGARGRSRSRARGPVCAGGDRFRPASQDAAPVAVGPGDGRRLRRRRRQPRGPPRGAGRGRLGPIGRRRRRRGVREGL